MSERRDYWRQYRRDHPQGPRDRASYFAAYHAARREARNAARRGRYVAKPAARRKASLKRLRAARMAEVEARGVIDRTAVLAIVAGSVELRRLVAEQEADDRRLQVKYDRGVQDLGVGRDGALRWRPEAA